jgi:hypothetical protein
VGSLSIAGKEQGCCFFNSVEMDSDFCWERLWSGLAWCHCLLPCSGSLSHVQLEQFVGHEFCGLESMSFPSNCHTRHARGEIGYSSSTIRILASDDRSTVSSGT